MKTVEELRTWCAEHPNDLLCMVDDLMTYGALNVWRCAIARVIYTRTGTMPDAMGLMQRGRDILAQLNQLNADAAVQSVADDYRLYL